MTRWLTPPVAVHRAALERDPSDPGRVSYRSFMAAWGKGQKEDRAVVSKVRGISKAQLKQMIVAKIQQRMKGGPGGLNRAFQFFDGDGSGSISLQELKQALRTLVGLEFDKEVLQAAFVDFAEGGDSIDFSKFARNVLGSKTDDSTSFNSNSNKNLRRTSSHGSGDVKQQIRRQIRQQSRNLQREFRHADTDEAGELHVDMILRVLEKLNIDVPDDEWSSLVAKMKPSSAGMVDYEDNFFALFRMGQEDEKLDAIIGTVKGLTVEQAMQLIRDKIRGRLAGGPSELQRTFQFFDSDGGGSIDLGEFRESLKLRCGLQFEESLLQQIMSRLDTNQKGELDFNAFAKFVMGSGDGTSDATTFGAHLEQPPETEQFIRSKVRYRYPTLPVRSAPTCVHRVYLTGRVCVKGSQGLEAAGACLPPCGGWEGGDNRAPQRVQGHSGAQ
jgi:Ca2+-binding EF-hand superfamily protein